MIRKQQPSLNVRAVAHLVEASLKLGFEGQMISSPIDRIIHVLPARLAHGDRKRKSDGAPRTAVITKMKPQTKLPNLYRVLLLDDDYTPMDFVVHILERFFHKNYETAHRIMMRVHQHGIGECGIYTHEVAETKVLQVMDFTHQHRQPLRCIMEKS